MEVNPTGHFNAKGNCAERQNTQRGRNGAFWQVMRKETEAKQHRIQHIASDIAMLKRNNAELSGRPDFHIQEQWLVSLSASKRIKVSVRISRSFQISLLSILQKQLMLSAGKIQRRVEAGQICSVTMKMLKSRKLKAAEYEFQLSAETLYARRRIVLKHR
ncbi:TPA: DUF1062 domain-containing protein [Citrobacter amalonaticus]|nr:DUF1062 domain-containing protein [Citrobacter amalonaticus]